eukprot:689971-Amorphochlora_amoeboformis.AAC.1
MTKSTRDYTRVRCTLHNPTSATWECILHHTTRECTQQHTYENAHNTRSQLTQSCKVPAPHLDVEIVSVVLCRLSRISKALTT